MRRVAHTNVYNSLFPVFLLAASWSIARGAVTGKVDSTGQNLGNTAPPSAVVSPECASCETCPTPCGGVLPHQQPDLPHEELPKQEQPHEQPPVECSPTYPSAGSGCLPQPYYYATGKPNTLYPYRPYDYEYYNGGETRVQKMLPMVVMLMAALLVLT